MQDLAWTLRQRRSALSYRIAITANSMPDLRSKILAHLQQNETETGIKALPVPEPGRTYRILGVFTGQGAQYARTGAELIEQSPAARAIIEDLELKLAELPSNDRPTWSLQAEIGADATASRVHEAIVSQPLCTAVQILIIELLRLAKVEFAAVVGHSSGEIAAAFAAGYLTAREAIYIAYYRGLHLRSAVSPQGQETRGAMLAVGSSMEEMSKLCRNPEFAGRVTVAASNSSSNVTLSGDEDAIVALQIYFDREKMFNRRLKVDKAYHSAHVAPCSDPYIHSLKACVRERQVQEPGKTCLWFSSVYNTPVDPSLGVSAAYWAENMAKPVLFSQALIKASTEMSLDAVLEIGPHPTLKGPASQTIKDALSSTSRVVPYLGTLSRGVSAIDAFATCLGHLWWHLGPGAVSLDSFERAMSGANRKFSVVKGLPSYPWDHSASYWHEARASRKMKSRKQQVHLLLGDISSDSASHHLRWRNLLRIQEMEWLSGHRIEGQVVFPAAGYICTALEASRMLSGEQDILMIELQEFDVHQAVLLPEDDAGVEVLIELMINPTAQKDCMNARFTYSAALGANVEDLTLAASGNVTVRLGKPSVSLLPRRPTSSSLTHGTKVDTNRFYSALGDIGYTFGGRFCALSELVRKHQRSSSLVKVAHPDAGDESLLIHPADLDAAFQSILLARSYPGDGQLSALHLPTAIRHIRVNPALCRAVDTQGAQIIALDGIVVSGAGDESGIVGDVNLYSSSCPHAMIQLQGANSTPLGGATTKGDDKKLFSTVHWIKQSLDASNFDAVTQYQRDAMKVLEQTSISYLQQFDRQIPSDHSLRSEPPLSFNLGLARRTTSLIQSGEDEPGSKVCTGGTLYHAVGASREFAELPDVRLGKLLGEQLPRLLRGETTMHEQLRQANLLCEYYTNGVVVRASFSWIIGILKQIVDLLPRMNILEIGTMRRLYHV